MEYILSCFAAGNNDDKLQVKKAEYDESLNEITIATTATELRTIFNKQMLLIADLRGSERAVDNAAYALDIRDRVSGLSFEYKMEVRNAIQVLNDPAKAKDPTIVQNLLEGIVASMALTKTKERDRAQAAALATRQAAPPAAPAPDQTALANLLAAAANLPTAAGTRPENQCEWCGGWHTVPPGEECHALVLSRGEEVPGWERKSPAEKERITARSAAINDKGLFKDRADVSFP